MQQCNFTCRLYSYKLVFNFDRYFVDKESHKYSQFPSFIDGCLDLFSW